MENGQVAKDVYRKYKLGEHFDDAELLIAQEYFMDVGCKLMALGDMFFLAAVECIKTAMAFRDFAKARGIWHVG